MAKCNQLTPLLFKGLIESIVLVQGAVPRLEYTTNIHSMSNRE